MPVSVRIRRGTAAAWTSANPVLALGEQGFETDTRKMKVGDGSTAWNSLGYISTTAVWSDGDKGDITVSGAGTALNIDPDVVTNAKLANMDTARIKGRITAAVGDPEDLTAAQAKTVLAITAPADIANFNEAAQDAVGAMVDNATLEYIDATPLMRVKDDGISNAKLADAPQFTLKGNLSGIATNPGDNNMAAVKSALAITAPADISNFAEAAQDAVGSTVGSGLEYNDTLNSIFITDSGVLNSHLTDMAANTIKGRLSSLGNPQDLTGTQVTTLLDIFTSVLKGLVPASAGGTANYLRADGAWVAPIIAVPEANWPPVAPQTDILYLKVP